MTAPRPTKPSDRYRVNRRGNIVRDTRTMSDAYIDPRGNGYETGMPLYAPRKSSAARLAFKAARRAARHAARVKAAA